MADGLTKEWREALAEIERRRSRPHYKPAAILSVLAVLSKGHDPEEEISLRDITPHFHALLEGFDPKGAEKVWEPFFHLGSPGQLWLRQEKDPPPPSGPTSSYVRRSTNRAVIRKELQPFLATEEGRSAVRAAVLAMLASDDNDWSLALLATISVGHLYNLRNSVGYRRQRIEYASTRPTPVSIGERRKPHPQGRPGFLRIDTVHQGDQDGVKGVYHINAVDEVTQWQVAGAVSFISEAWLLPVLQAILVQFPFRVRGFHSDNGSEFINHRVAELLNKLLIEQTKSRPRHSNDNGLVEAKNGAVIRKHMGYLHIQAEHADAIHEFYRDHFTPYLNFHRPCGQPEITTDAQGKQKRIYKRYATPWEVFSQLPQAAKFLRRGQTMTALKAEALRCGDTEAAARMQQAKHELFRRFYPEARPA